jgi:acylpyruvate hydrolase
MRSFLEMGEDGMEIARRLLEGPPGGAVLDKRELTICSPLCSEERPKLLCIGLNYVDHAAESGSKVPDQPLVFAKYATTLIGPGESIVPPPDATALDYEVELVVVIGKKAKRVAEAEAFEHVAGYTCGNDVTERRFQRRDGQWLRGKSSDTFAPLGPVIVTRDEIFDPHNLNLGSKVNGEVRQHSNTKQIIFRVPKLIEYISTYITLEPGDLIFTGTLPGVGFAMKPPQFLRAGDRVEVWVEKIGNLMNSVGGAG